MNSKKTLKGVILSAGFGTRLKPMTDYIPKPLVPMLGIPNLFLLMNKLQRVGIHSIAVNTHWKHEMIGQAIENSPYKDLVTLFYEKEILGTAGVYPPLSTWRDDHDLLVINSDIFSSILLEEIIDFYYAHNFTLVMGLLPHPHPKGKNIWLKEDHSIAHISEKKETEDNAQSHGFTGIQIISGEFLKSITEKSPKEIIPIYQKALENGVSLGGYVFKKEKPFVWEDIGSIESYFNTQMFLVKALSTKDRLFFEELGFNKSQVETLFHEEKKDKQTNTTYDPIYIKKTAHLSSGSVIGPHAILYDNVIVQENSTIQNSIIFPGVMIKQNQSITNQIIGKDFSLSF